MKHREVSRLVRAKRCADSCYKTCRVMQEEMGRTKERELKRDSGKQLRVHCRSSELSQYSGRAADRRVLPGIYTASFLVTQVKRIASQRREDVERI